MSYEPKYIFVTDPAYQKKIKSVQGAPPKISYIS